MPADDMRDRILVAALAHVPFDGWTERSLRAGAVDAGFVAADGLRAFPAGPLAAIDRFCDLGDRLMAEELAKRNLAALRVRDRIAAAVRARLDVVAEHREAVRRTIAFLALPQNAGTAAHCTWRTVDAMWYAAGDTATDFNFYTKRGLLAAVYGATVLCWLGDSSEGAVETRAFLDRRIAGVMALSQVRARAAEAADGAAECLRTLLRRRF